MKQQMFVAALAVLSAAAVSCSAPPPGPSAPSVADLQKNCVASGRKFVVHADGSWECVPALQPAPTSAPVYVPPTSVPRPTSLPPAQSVYTRWINYHTQMCLTAPAGGGRASQEACGSGDNQKWKKPDSNFFRLQAANEVCLGFTGDHAELVATSCGSTQMWSLVPFCPYGGCVNPGGRGHEAAVLERGLYYEIVSAGQWCVDVEGWNHDVGGPVIWDHCRGEDNANQLWAMH